MAHCILFLALLLYNCSGFSATKTSIFILPHEKAVQNGESSSFQFETGSAVPEDLVVNFIVDHPEIVDVYPKSISIPQGQSSVWNITLKAKSVGHAKIVTNITPENLVNDAEGFIDTKVQHSTALDLFSFIVGWMYFVAWSVSFYPQIFENWRRKCVVGLNFDFIFLNFIGFSLYSVFNCAMRWDSNILDQFQKRYPRSENPVMLNDVVFSLHAVLATMITIFQCLIYERGDQRISIVARSIIGVCIGLVALSAILAGSAAIWWLDFLYICSYIKLAITLIKYVPQAYMNYKRKSTIGWSIGNILLDFTGGTLSMLQMLINAYNFNDWESIFGDPTKFGLGLFSVFFDIFFMIQHFILYRAPSEKIYTLNY